MRIHFLRNAEKKKIIKDLDLIYGIRELPYLLLESGKDKVRAFSGSLSRVEILKVAKVTSIEGIGLYLLKRGEGFRLSFDATQILKPWINKSIVKLNDEQFKSWIAGEDIDIETRRGIVVISNGEDFFGCGKSNGSKIFNQIPKERRIKL